MTNIIVRSQLGIPVIEVRGELYRTEIDELKERVQEFLADDRSNIILDLSGCTHMDSAGLGQIVQCWRDCERATGTLKLLGPFASSIRHKFEITKLDTVFDMFDNEPEAVASFN